MDGNETERKSVEKVFFFFSILISFNMFFCFEKEIKNEVCMWEW